MATKKSAPLGFLSNFKKEVDKMEDIGTDSLPPRYWISSGNYVQNFVMSGKFSGAIPQGRIVNFCGPSGCLTEDQEVFVYVMQTLEHDGKIVTITEDEHSATV